ncbi:hypothetical protein HAX54_000073, partial [Datura stramonium]|nr:hypothetical protein [Datura stramonium]
MAALQPLQRSHCSGNATTAAVSHLRGSVKRVGLLAVVNNSPKKEGGVGVGLRVFRVVNGRREEKREEGDLVVLGLVAGHGGERLGGREIEEGQCWSELCERRRVEGSIWVCDRSGERRGFTVIVVRGKEEGYGEDKQRVKPLLV